MAVNGKDELLSSENKERRGESVFGRFVRTNDPTARSGTAPAFDSQAAAVEREYGQTLSGTPSDHEARCANRLKAQGADSGCGRTGRA